jgi:hypothetical protein
LALYLPPLEAAALLLPIVLCQDAISVYVYRREWSGWNLKLLLPGAAVGIILGWLFAAHVSDAAIRILIGGTALAFVASAWIGPAHNRLNGGSTVRGLVWGAISGFSSFASQGGALPGLRVAAAAAENGFCRYDHHLLRRRECDEGRALFHAWAIFRTEFRHLAAAAAARRLDEFHGDLAGQIRSDQILLCD